MRFSFCDQHGVLRGKTLVAPDAPRAMRSGVTMTSTLLAKDTSHRTVFPVFSAGGGIDLAEMEGAGNFVMVADPATFRVLPWAETEHRLDAVRHLFHRTASRCRSRRGALYRDALGKLAKPGFDFLAGLEVEFHLFKLDDPKLAPADADLAAEAPAVSHTTHGFQYLTEARFDQVDPILDDPARASSALGMPLRSLEVELGPSQYEFTFAPQTGLAPADTMVLFRSAMKQVARRHGYLVELHVPAGAAQRVRQRLASAPVAARPQIADATRSSRRQARSCCRRSAALSRRPAGACARRGGVHHADRQRLQALSRRQLDGADPGDLGARQSRRHDPRAGRSRAIRRRIWRTASASRSPIRISTWRRRFTPASTASRASSSPARPPMRPTRPRPSRCRSLAEALAALSASACSAPAFGDAFVDYFTHIKQAEIARFKAEAGEQAEPTAWEQNEYFDMF